MKVRVMLRLLHYNGWRLVATRGSQRQFKHPDKPGRVTLAGKDSDELSLDTLKSILRQAQLKEIGRALRRRD